MKKYEAVFIFAPDLAEEDRVSKFTRLKNVIETTGTTVENDEWGTRKLAYEIDDHKEGYYYVLRFEATNEVLLEVNRICRITDGLLRELVVAL